MSTERDVATLLETRLQAQGYELIEAEYVRARQLWRLFIDRPDSKPGQDLISFDDCSTVSNWVEDWLIEAGIDYEYLEVSSPGIDRALTKPQHFSRFAGETVRLSLQPPLDGKKKLQGELLGFADDAVQLNVSGEVFTVPYSHVSRARVVPKF